MLKRFGYLALCLEIGLATEFGTFRPSTANFVSTNNFSGLRKIERFQTIQEKSDNLSLAKVLRHNPMQFLKL